MSITIHPGSILEAGTEVIVNPANGHLNHAGGLARVIDRAAAPNRAKYPERPEMWQAEDWEWVGAHIEAPLIATGNAYLTSAGALPFKAVIHAVGPIWNGGAFNEDNLLVKAHMRAMDVAHAAGFRSIAFPAISCGIFGFPVDRAAELAVGAVRWALLTQRDPMDVRIALMEDEHVKAYSAALSQSER